MKYRKTAYILYFLLLIPLSLAAEEEKCGLTNLATCIPQKFFEFILSILNAPIQPFLDLIKSLLSEPVIVEPFLPLWSIIIYIISLFYGLLLLFSGFNFVISGYSPEKRDNAKEWLKNIVIMILLVQSSFFLYQIINELSSSLTAGVINLIDENFFLLTADSFGNFGIQLLLTIPYLIVLLITIILLAVRYIIVACGVIFFPIALFLNFIPHLKSYGKLILNFLFSAIFLTFFVSLILLFSSKLIDIPVFSGIKIIITIASFALVILVFIFLIFFVCVKSANSVINSDVGKAGAFLIGRWTVPASKTDKSQKSLKQYL